MPKMVLLTFGTIALALIGARVKDFENVSVGKKHLLNSMDNVIQLLCKNLKGKDREDKGVLFVTHSLSFLLPNIQRHSSSIHAV